MSLWFLDPDERLEDGPEILSFCAGESSGHILPASESWPNSETCPASFFVRISHLLNDPYLLHEKAGAGTGKPGPRSGHAEALVIPNSE